MGTPGLSTLTGAPAGLPNTETKSSSLKSAQASTGSAPTPLGLSAPPATSTIFFAASAASSAGFVPPQAARASTSTPASPPARTTDPIRFPTGFPLLNRLNRVEGPLS